eukprot:scaffold199425_cov18-Tisochrysis_lutea.AAC.1
MPVAGPRCLHPRPATNLFHGLQQSLPSFHRKELSLPWQQQNSSIAGNKAFHGWQLSLSKPATKPSIASNKAFHSQQKSPPLLAIRPFTASKRILHC